MQWAQRSRECPLCFKSLQLEVRLRCVRGLCSACCTEPTCQMPSPTAQQPLQRQAWLPLHCTVMRVPACLLMHGAAFAITECGSCHYVGNCLPNYTTTQHINHQYPHRLRPAPPQDEDMNTLLPFGEYISPEQRAAEAASFETWELERLLLRLAAASQREQQRQHRSSWRATTGSSAGGGGGSRHRRQGSRGEASAPQPIRGSEAAAAAAAAEGGSSGHWAIAGEGSSSSALGGRPSSAPGPSFHGSWPPPAGLQASSSSGHVDEGHVVSPGSSRSSSLSLKSRLASLRLR